MVKKISLGGKRFVLVDDEDAERVLKFTWNVYSSRHGKKIKYAITAGGGRSKKSLHRFILWAQKWQIVDHINGDVFDNRKENLRFCTNAENHYNMAKQVGCSSQFKGVSWHRGARKWVSMIHPGGKATYLGLFVDERKAAAAYDIAARKYFGEFARLNFNG